MRPSLRFAAACAGLWLLAAPTGRAAAEPVTVLRSNGPDFNRINVAVLGDGYTADELGQYSTDVDLLLNELFRETPFAEYAAYFNVRRIDVTSEESGADHPSQGLYRDTALGAAYDCLDISHLICVDEQAVLDVLERSVPPAAQDIVVVLVNDDRLGGSGSRFAVTSTHDSGAETLLHEIGHSFGLLADEHFSADSAGRCDASLEPAAVNVTRESTRETIKWSYWIEPDTAVPAGPAEHVPGVVSAYEGANYCETGLYRPTFDSKMRTSGMPFEQVNTEQLIRRIYNWVSPIDAVIPAAGELASDRCEFLDFSVEIPGEPDGLPGTLEVVWRLDDEVVEGSDSLTLVSCELAPGSHVVEVEVRDTTDAVRRDPDDLLVERMRWEVEAPDSESVGRDAP